METLEPINMNQNEGFGISNEIKSYLKETAKWAKFIAIVGFVGVGFMILGAIGMGFFMGSMTSDFGGAGMPFPPALISIVYIILAGITVFPILYLYRFASKMQLALKNENNALLTESFKNLKSHYKFYGIFMAIFIGFYLVMIVVSMLLGAGAMFMG